MARGIRQSSSKPALEESRCLAAAEAGWQETSGDGGTCRVMVMREAAMSLEPEPIDRFDVATLCSQGGLRIYGFPKSATVRAIANCAVKWEETAPTSSL